MGRVITGDGTRTHDLRIMRPPGATPEATEAYAIKSTSGTFPSHPDPSTYSDSDSGVKATFQAGDARMAILDHQDSIGDTALALLLKSLPTDPDLLAVVEAWPTLAEAARASVLAIVRSSGEPLQ
jgi:hypothetical protein